MGEQDIEIKKDLVSRLLKKEGRSPYFAQGLFLGLGLVLTLSAFLILQSFIQGLSQEERSRLNQGFVEEVVEDFYQLNEPLEAVSRLILLSEGQAASKIKKVLSGETDDYARYSQILWFKKPEGKGWSFSSLLDQNLQAEIDAQARLKTDSALLKALLAQGVQGFSQTRIVKEIGGFKLAQLRQSPKILAMPVVLARAVNVAEPEKGFLVAVLNVDGLFDENWINAHKDLFYVRVQPVESNVPLFEFDRNPGGNMSVRKYGQTYEFPFAGRNLEVTSAFVENQRSKFLSFFPYIVAVFGLLMAGAGTVYIRHSQGQADVLADMNEALEQKNFELKIEADERERLSEAVREAEVQSRAMIDAVSDIIFEADDGGSILFLNTAWQEITGFDTEQSKGQKLSQLIHPQDREKVEQGFKAVLDGKKKNLSCYTQIRVSDGTFKAVELSINIIEGSGGTRLIGTFRDIEERRKVERALSDAEKKYRSIVENAAGGIFQLTPEGLYLSANPALARILGYDSAEQLLRDVKNANEQLYVNADQRSGFYKKLMTANETLSQEIQMRRKDGGIIWVDESARAVADENGQILFIEGSIEDITQRKESEQAIREAKVSSDLANRAKSEFLSNMSHELRTPLNSIIGFSEMIKNEVYGKIEHRAYWEYARDIYDSGQKLLRVINEILDISKIEAGERQLNEGVVNIKGLVDGVIDLLDVKIENTQMVITQALDDVPDIIGEELALKQIVMNLMSNAVKYTPDKGRITISAHVNKDGRLHFSVTDTGIGLDEYEIKKALSPFGQVDNELSRSGSGTGLGLTLVDALVKLHGGDFELFSQKGIGTTATVILPADRVVKKDQQEGEKRAEFIDVKEQKPKGEDVEN